MLFRVDIIRLIMQAWSYRVADADATIHMTWNRAYN